MDTSRTDNDSGSMGWVCLHRAVGKHWIFEDSEKFGAWVKILLSVNHAPRNVLIKGKLLEVKRGESVMSLESWVRCFGKRWTKDKVRSFLKLLKSDHMITTVNEGVTLRLSVTNYSKHQNITTIIPRTSHAHPTHVPPNNNDNNEKQDFYSKDFERFWGSYPRKVGKGGAFKAWGKAKSKPPVADIIKTVNALRTSAQWQKEDGQYIPHPQTWINARGWDDVVEEGSQFKQFAQNGQRMCGTPLCDGRTREEHLEEFKSLDGKTLHPKFRVA